MRLGFVCGWEREREKRFFDERKKEWVKWEWVKREGER
jgi:hypothetical protein